MSLDPNYTSYLSQLEQQYQLPTGLLATQANAESGGDPSAVSPKGALGMFQFMPDTAKQYGIDPTDPIQAAQGAAKMNADMLAKYNGDLPSALAAYNWGSGNVDRKGLDNAPAETKDYVSKIVSGLPAAAASALSAIGNVMMPSAQAADYDKLTDEQLLAEAQKQGIVPQQDYSQQSPQQQVAGDVAQEDQSQGDPSGLNAQPWSALHIQSQPLGNQVTQPTNYDTMSDADLLAEAQKQGIKTVSPDQLKLQNARASVATSLPAQLTAYGANAMHAISNVIPGLPQAGSALAAVAGYGQGDTFSERYKDLQASQKAMRQAGEENNPGATALGQLSGNVLGAGLGGATLEALAPEKLAAFTKYAASNPKTAAAISNAIYGGLMGFNQGDDTKSRLADAAEDAGIGVITGPLVSSALRYIGGTRISQAAGNALSKLADYLGPDVDQAASGGLDSNLNQDSYNIVNQQGRQATPDDIVKDFADKPAVDSTPSGGTIGGIVKGLVTRPEDEDVQPLSKEATDVAGQFYQRANESGQVYPSSFTDKIVSMAEKAAPQTLAGKLTTGTSPIADLAARWQALKGQTLDLPAIQEMDEGLGDLIENEWKNGKLSKQGRQLVQLQGNIRNAIDQEGGTAGSDLANARLAWKQSMKLRDLERIQERASMADNPATMIKSGIRTLLSNPNKSRWYDKGEISALKVAQDRGVVGSAAHVFGSRLLPMGATLVGEAVGGIPGAIIGGVVGHGGSSAMRGIGTALQKGRMTGAMQTIMKKVPKP